MNVQRSFENTKRGNLYVVATPIGNLDDITIRALKTLEQVDVIAAEDTRNSKKLLNHFDIHKPLVSYHEHNKLSREDHLVDTLQEGKDIALISDAGMPAISDPGYEMVKAAIKRDIPVIVIPGANAALTALVASGLPTEEFYYYGFLPRKKKEKEEELLRLSSIAATVIFYESPYRIEETIEAIVEVLGERQICLARELTKKFEEYARGTGQEILDWLKEQTVRGEFCIVVEGNQSESKEEDQWWAALTVEQHVTHYITELGLRSKDAIKKVATERNLPKREVYQAFHVEE
ncbi:16S rRNA (cytidine(1402)-2'-O)-methyltransferase (plasmid) [Radiobacillus kanasensis]|uniref:16S rRNA (cytidine(1402)-2'-O)-methyltransferase n=1 Tax=Radiobacillus kanasensis TaxID=2844358 RepID=UPI001E4C62E0|nr:16S rRNA (cytidine(1402)-2'-O)-methyltransferase [Radiobacillus kanasensis]UFU01507.1 16S rRNA (cytidine(1402)-2'-O)-methyltransferase [Radiobacillus kanasensis]